MPKQQRIRDPLHDLIEFDVERSQLENVLWRVIQTRPFQRLRRIKQLGFSDFVYPGATHSRLIHSAGVFHTARRLMKVIEKYLPAKDARVDQALAAALVHDLGHGPFSHAFEKIGERFNLKMANHEAVSDILIRDSEVSKELREMGSGFANDVADMVSGSGTPTIYSAVVSSQFDADRLDYMRRDRLMTGTQHAGIDFEWLIANLEVGEVEYSVDTTRLKPVQTFVLGRKAIFAAEAYVLGLFQLYPTVYFHKATRGA
ncbi:MAG: HD domain-containing protein [Afipia sp.]|nr:HD domain-containing protein [Afipia sp.]